MSHLQSNTIFAGRYTLFEKLGIGGYSEVWKAADNMAGEMLVALKIFAPDKGLDQSGIQTFSKEYGLVFNLNHANLLKPSHFDIWEGSPYLVMPYCKNGSVYGKLGEMSETEILRFICQAASALQYLHNQPIPIIHQDIKPDNFLIDDNGNYLLSDFGISSRLRRTLTRSVGEVSSAGTIAYMPPERFGKVLKSTPACDIFSLGVTIFEILTEQQPFGEHGGLLLKNGADIPDLPVTFSSELSTLVLSCFNIDPALRLDAKTLEARASELAYSSRNLKTVPLLVQPIPMERHTIHIPSTPSLHITETKKSQSKPSGTISIKSMVFITILGLSIILFIVLKFPSNNNTSNEEPPIEDIPSTLLVSPNNASHSQSHGQSGMDNKTNIQPNTGSVDNLDKEKLINEDEPGEVYTLVEEMPSFAGGDVARNKFLGDNIVYPQRAAENGIQGTIYVSFIIDSKGNITDVKLLRGIGGGCDEEAVRVVKMMPRWQPGKQDGKPVRVLFNMPLYFKLQG